MAQAKRGTVPVDSLVEDFFVRTRINDDHVYHLATLYDAGVKLPPLLVTKDGNRVIEGRHRLAALKFLDKKAADVEWIEETDSALLIAMAVKANVGGSLPPTNSDIIYAIRQMLMTDMVHSAVLKQFDRVWPAAVVRRYLADAQSSLTKERVLQAREAIADRGMTVGEAAQAYKIKPDTLKAAITERKKRKGSIGEYKAGLTSIFRSRGGSMGAMMRKVQHQMEDHEISWSTVEAILQHAETCCKSTAESVRDWRKRFEALNGKGK